MDITIYTDDSGTFDCVRGGFFVFGGILFLDLRSRESFSRKYAAIEKAVSARSLTLNGHEPKASNLTLNERRALFRATNKEFRFAIVVDIQKLRIRNNIAHNKREKQRFLDFAYKIGVKRFFEYLIRVGYIDPDKVRTLYFYNDQHTTATNGRYELEDGLRKEFLDGTPNFDNDCFFPPLFPKMERLKVTYCDSKHVTLVRTADIIANRVYQKARHNELDWKVNEHFHVIRFPRS